MIDWDNIRLLRWRFFRLNKGPHLCMFSQGRQVPSWEDTGKKALELEFLPEGAILTNIMTENDTKPGLRLKQTKVTESFCIQIFRVGGLNKNSLGWDGCCLKA
jgi:hypothetical protein